jgi:hypothetical protein
VIFMQIYCSRIVLVLLVTLLSSWGQQPPPAVGPSLPDPGPHRIEVRFAFRKTAVKCKKFHLVAREDGQVLFSGSFNSGFDIPRKAENLPRREALELDFRCSVHRWRFSKVPESAFVHGWWWVGTDYPPFHEILRSPDVKDAVWMRYFIVDAVGGDSGFYVFKACPAKLKDQNPGPCYEN